MVSRTFSSGRSKLSLDIFPRSDDTAPISSCWLMRTLKSGERVQHKVPLFEGGRLPKRVFEALSTTFEGVVAMHRMMEGEEPGLLRDAARVEESINEMSLKQLMRDPRYWKHQDPAIVEKVREGFRRLYQDKV